MEEVLQYVRAPSYPSQCYNLRKHLLRWNVPHREKYLTEELPNLIKDSDLPLVPLSWGDQVIHRLRSSPRIPQMPLSLATQW